MSSIISLSHFVLKYQRCNSTAYHYCCYHLTFSAIKCNLRLVFADNFDNLRSSLTIFWCVSKTLCFIFVTNSFFSHVGLSWHDPAPFQAGETLGNALLCPTKIYVANLMPLVKDGLLKVMGRNALCYAELCCAMPCWAVLFRYLRIDCTDSWRTLNVLDSS